MYLRDMGVVKKLAAGVALARLSSSAANGRLTGFAALRKSGRPLHSLRSGVGPSQDRLTGPYPRCHQPTTITSRQTPIAIRFKRRFLFTSLITAHLRIESADSVPLPNSGTGYKSHFMTAGMTDAGLPARRLCVGRWLDDAAKAQDWREAQNARAQLTLF